MTLRHDGRGRLEIDFGGKPGADRLQGDVEPGGGAGADHDIRHPLRRIPRRVKPQRIIARQQDAVVIAHAGIRKHEVMNPFRAHRAPDGLAGLRIANDAPHAAQRPLHVSQHGFPVLRPVGRQCAGGRVRPLVVREFDGHLERGGITIAPVLQAAVNGIPVRAIDDAVGEGRNVIGPHRRVIGRIAARHGLEQRHVRGRTEYAAQVVVVVRVVHNHGAGMQVGAERKIVIGGPGHEGAHLRLEAIGVYGRAVKPVAEVCA